MNNRKLLFLLIASLSTKNLFAIKQGAVNIVTASEVFDRWNTTETIYYIPGSMQNGTYAKSIDDFCTFLYAYQKTYQYSFCKDYFPNAISTYNNIIKSSNSLYHAAYAKNYDEIAIYRLKIFKSVSDWQNIEFTSYKTANYSYNSITLFLIILIIIFIGLVVFYAIALTKSKLAEKTSVEFSARIQNAQETERRRLSQELHDTVAQDLRYTSILASRLSEKDIAAEIDKNQMNCIEQIRTICYNLFPPDLDNDDLTNAITTLCSKYNAKTNVSVRLTIINGTCMHFSKDKALDIFRIVQELLTNISKHANAKEITVLFRTDDTKENLVIVISDDGCGMDKKMLDALNKKTFDLKMQDDRLHFGIHGLKERTSRLGGSITYASFPESGTDVTVIIPYDSKQEK